MQKLKIAALLIILIIVNVAAAGCISDEETKEPKLKLTLVGGGHKIYAGDTTTYIVMVENNREENDTFNLSVTSKPTGWEVILNQTNMFLRGGFSHGIFVVVNSSSTTGTGDHKVRIKAVSGTFGNKKTLSITTKVISDSRNRVIVGDKVTLGYFGYLQDYSVFDTSYQNIGTNANIRKASIFVPPSQGYIDLNVYVGPEDPDDKDPFVQTVGGFWEAIVGMKNGQSRTVTFPPEKGYANFINATVNITEEIKMIETMTVNEFTLNYPNEQLILGVSMEHHIWKWNFSIDYINETEDLVSIINEPNLNQIVNPYGWETKVTYKNQSDNDGEGRIIVKHTAQSGMEAEFEGFPAEVISVEEDQIHLKVNNSPHELANEILTFDITLIEIQD
jgi:FKBP-type peptidyl-prolyl cis-trans isomerase 2